MLCSVCWSVFRFHYAPGFLVFSSQEGLPSWPDALFHSLENLSP